MINLSFYPQEIQYAKTIYDNVGNWIPKFAQQVMGQDYYSQMSETVKYLVKLMQDDYFKEMLQDFGNIQVWDEMPSEQITMLQQHYKRMHQKYQRASKFYTTDDFAVLALDEVHSYVKFRNLEAPFDIYNDGRYVDEKENRYELVKKGNKKTKIKTSRCPYAESEEDLEGYPDAKVEKDEYDPNKYTLEVENSHVGILNRFAILISTKQPQFHSGCCVHINGAGNVIYVYAIELSKDYNLDKRIATRGGVMTNFLIVAAYGFTNKELAGYNNPATGKRVIGMLEKVSDYIKTNCDVRVSLIIRPEHEFEEKINWLVDLPEDTTFGEGGEMFDGADDMFSDSGNSDSSDDMFSGFD